MNTLSRKTIIIAAALATILLGGGIMALVIHNTSSSKPAEQNSSQDTVSTAVALTIEAQGAISTAVAATTIAMAPTNTPVPPTATVAPPTATPIPPTATSVPPTNTPIPPTATLVPPTATPVPPTATPIPPTNTPIPPTATSIPINTPTPILNPGNIGVIPTISVIPGGITFSKTLEALPGESGTVVGYGDHDSYESLLYVGDGTQNNSLQALLSFDISDIPASATIDEVKIDFSNYQILGDPFNSLGCLRSYPYNYGTLDSDDYYPDNEWGAIIRWCTANELSSVQANDYVKDALQQALGSDRFQMRLQFNEKTTDNDDIADAVEFTYPVRLIVTYR